MNHLEELMRSGRVVNVSIIVVRDARRQFQITLYDDQHRIVGTGSGDRMTEALRNAIGRLLTTNPPYLMPPGL